MDMESEGYMDEEQSWLRQIEADSEEAAEFELENARALIEADADDNAELLDDEENDESADTLSDGEAGEQRKSGLLEKLKADPEQNFSVSDYSTYKENRWVFTKDLPTAHVKNLLFNSDLPGSNELKKMLAYHLIPQFHPFGGLRSFNTTVGYSWGFGYVEEYLFKANGLDATPESIRAISAKLINDALDRARDTGTASAFFRLYFMITFWQSLSAQALIPASHRLDVPLRLIDTKERQQEIRKRFAAEYKGWQPFNEEELSKLVEYALFWVEKAAPALQKIIRFIEKHRLVNKTARFFVRARPWQEFENVLGEKIEGITVCGYQIKCCVIKVKRGTTEYEYPQYRYSYSQKLRRAIDRVRDGLLILVALITGMRVRELAALTFDDVVQRGEGEWFINVTRFKTSYEPNYFGESELIPLPTFIAEYIQEYKKLRSHNDFMRSGVLFEQISGHRAATVFKQSIQRAMVKLGQEVGVFGVHPHRFRKTIAEILINRSERNIDLIRLLFGHRSYTMTLRYIARNPYLVASVAETLETHFTEEFLEIVAAVRDGAYSGAAAERIAKAAESRPELFKGRLIRMTVFNYIAHLLAAGEPVFIKRTGIGTYCVSCESYSQNNLPPCLEKSGAMEGNIMPDPSNCRLDCRNAVVLEKARETLQTNIVFYKNLITQSAEKLSNAARKELMTRITANEKHLAALSAKENVSTSEETGVIG